ncbi:MAG: low molecular weight protein-tyrosine-phosphatase [Gemmatimonadota bacterium]
MNEPSSGSATRVLFVCLGNICRSPVGEALFRHHAGGEGAAGAFEVDSAGTAAYHIGEPPDRRSAETALRRGVVVSGRARRLEADDYYEFDHIVAMDRSNLAEIKARKPADATARVHLLRSFDPAADDDADVPDPYYGGPSGFDDVHDMVERSTRALLAHLIEELS